MPLCDSCGATICEFCGKHPKEVKRLESGGSKRKACHNCYEKYKEEDDS